MSFPLPHNHSTFSCIRIVRVAYRTGFLLLSIGFAGHLYGMLCSSSLFSFLRQRQTLQERSLLIRGRVLGVQCSSNQTEEMKEK